MTSKMTPSRPYLLRAYFDWLLDNDLTPHLVVNALETGVVVPQEFVQNGQIVLNIDPCAVAAFSMDLSTVSFNARFGGVPRDIYIPMAAVLAIYARETGAGTVFEPEAAYEEHTDLASAQPQEQKRTESETNFGLVKPDSKSNSDKSSLSAEDLSKSSAKKAKKPSLRIVK